MARVRSLVPDSFWTLPLAGGASLRLTPFRESARVALTVHDQAGVEIGGVVLGPGRARLLAGWLNRAANECGAAADPEQPAPARLAGQGR